MKRTTEAPPFVFKTPRAAGEYLVAVTQDVLACPEHLRAIVATRSAAARKKAIARILQWNTVAHLAAWASDAVRDYAGLVYGDARNPYAERSRFHTFAQHVVRERKSAAFNIEQANYRREVGIDPDFAKKESA